MPRASRISAVVVVFLLALAVAGTLAARPGLDRSRRAVDERWLALRSGLDTRYQALRAAGDATQAALGEAREPLPALASSLSAWERARRNPAGSVRDQVLAANRVEGVAARLRASVDATARLRNAPPVTSALATFTASDPSATRRAYDEAVRRYEHDRRSGLARFAAGMLGFEARPRFVLP
jgi:LemA protein